LWFDFNAKGEEMCDTRINGLARDVHAALQQLSNVGKMTIGRDVRGYKGQPKVRLPGRWPHRRLVIVVCDKYGQREVCVQAEKPGAIRRILSRRLRTMGVSVCMAASA